MFGLKKIITRLKPNLTRCKPFVIPLDFFDNIYYVCLEEHEKKYSFLDGFVSELNDIDIENKSQLISRAPYIIEKLKQLSGYISPNESQIVKSVSSKPDMSSIRSYAPYESGLTRA